MSQGHQAAQGATSLDFPSQKLLCRFLPQECVTTKYFVASSQFLKREMTREHQQESVTTKPDANKGWRNIHFCNLVSTGIRKHF